MSVKSELFELIQISRTNPIEISLPIDKFFRVKENIDTELDYAEKCHNLEEEIGLTVEEMATILKDLKNIFQIKICFNPLSNKINGMTKYDLVLRQPLSINTLPSERNKHICVDMALTDENYKLYSKWLRKDKSE